MVSSEDLECGLLSFLLVLQMAHDQPDTWGCVKVHQDVVTPPKPQKVPG